MIAVIFVIRFPEIMHCSTTETWQNLHVIHCFGTPFCMSHIICHLTCTGHMKPVALPFYSRPSFIKIDNWGLTQQLFDFTFKFSQFLETDVFCSDQSSWAYLTSANIR